MASAKHQYHAPNCNITTGRGAGFSENIIIHPKCNCALSGRDTSELDAKIEACRAATQAYRDAWKRADDLTRELAAMGVCGTCAVGEHRMCRDYGCECCGGGK